LWYSSKLDPQFIFTIFEIKKMSLQRYFLILLVLVTFQISAQLPKDSLYFRTIKLKDGLPGSTIKCIEQDSLGFMWIGTNNGLCRYDGSQFKTYQHNIDNPNSLIDNDVQNIHLDQKGNLWIMSTEGLHYFDLRKQQLSRIIACEQEGSIADNSPKDMVERKDGTVYIGSYYSGISYKEKNAEMFSYISTESKQNSALSSNNINCMKLLKDSLIIIGYWDAGIDLFHVNDKNTYALNDLTTTKLNSDRINALCISQDKGVWIGTDKGISYYNFKTNALRNYSPPQNESSFLVDNDINSLFLDKDGNLWVGTQNNGLIILNESELLTKGLNTSFSHYQPNIEEGSLSYRTVLSIFQDSNGAMWIGTYGGGINYAENRYHRFNHLKHNPAISNSISYNKVWGLCEDNQGNIWIGTDGDGINLWNEKEGVFKQFKNRQNRKNELSDNAILCALTDYTGTIWVGTFEGGLNRYQPSDDSFIHYKAPIDLPKNDIRCIYEDEHQQLWIGMNRGGIAKYNRFDDRFEPIEQLAMFDVRSIVSDGIFLWIGTYGDGLIKYNTHNQQYIYFHPDEEQWKSVPIKTIYTLYRSSNKDLWIGTKDGGLLHMNTQTEKFTVYSTNKGLPNNNVHCILPYANNLWLSTNTGISLFNLNTKLFTNFNWTKGVQNEEFHDGSGLISSNGLFCFGGINGMNYFRPANFKSSISKAKIRFTKLSILNQEVTPNNNNSIEKSIEYSPIIHLNYNQSIFSIDFQSINYPFSEYSQYEYILDGYDTEWNNANGINSVTYRNIPAGEYTFKVKTSDSNELLDYAEASVAIVISPPYYKTGIAYALYLILMTTLFVAIFRFRVKQYKIKNRIEYERKLRGKEKKLHDERLEFFTNISHELRTPITIIGVTLEDIAALKTGHPKIRKSIDTALKNSAHLMELINKVLEFRQVETGVSNLAINQINLNSFLGEFLQGFSEMAKHNQIHLRLTLPINDVILWLDQDKWAMILNNLLSNAFKHTPSGGEIILSVNETDNNVIIKVKDSGKGIPKSIQSKIFQRYYKQDNSSTSTGIGLALTKSLVNLHHGKIAIESTTGKGASFILTFQKGNKHFTPCQIGNIDNSEVISEDTQENLHEEEELYLSKNQKILLLIDDNIEIVEILEDKFKNEYNIIKAYDGIEGLSLAQKHTPDLIISDIMMPKMNGIELCKEIKNDATTSHIPVILLTAKGTEEDEIIGLDTGADDYISKPFRIAILKARVNTILENRLKLYNYFHHQDNAVPINDINPEKERELEFLNKVEAYIIDNCLTNDISVFELASELGFSRTTLYRKIKSLTGLSINAFVRSVKLNKSANLIAKGMNVSEAAYYTGFNDLKYFRECFKKLHGKNPSEFK